MEPYATGGGGALGGAARGAALAASRGAACAAASTQSGRRRAAVNAAGSAARRDVWRIASASLGALCGAAGCLSKNAAGGSARDQVGTTLGRRSGAVRVVRPEGRRSAASRRRARAARSPTPRAARGLVFGAQSSTDACRRRHALRCGSLAQLVGEQWRPPTRARAARRGGGHSAF